MVKQSAGSFIGRNDKSMKLYAKILSERDSRAGNKGGDEFLEIELSAFGRCVGFIVLETVEDANGEPIQYLLKFAAHNDSLDWVILKEGHQTEGTIQTIIA
jgi:hypothetical protein